MVSQAFSTHDVRDKPDPLLQLISFAVRTTAGKVRIGKPPFLQCLANLIPQKGGELKGESVEFAKKKVDDDKPGLFLNRH